jgi:hypothetical protein
MASYFSSFFDANGVALPPRPFNSPMSGDPDCIQAAMSTAFLGDAAGVLELMPVPLGKQLVHIAALWGRADTNGTPTLATALYLRVTDKNGVNVDQLLYTPVMSAAQATPLSTYFPLQPSAGALGPIGGGLPAGTAAGYGRIVLKNTAAAATAAAVNFTLYASWK